MKKKKLITITSLMGIAIIVGLVIDRNRKLSGIILNQQHTIDGLLKDIKNLSYHLGKRQ